MGAAFFHNYFFPDRAVPVPFICCDSPELSKSQIVRCQPKINPEGNRKHKENFFHSLDNGFQKYYLC